jgi:GTP-binding nuclear protein Ran
MDVILIVQSSQVSHNSSSTMTTYKCALLGDSNVGKTTYLHKLVTGEFEKCFYPTTRATTQAINAHCANSDVSFNVIDTAGQEKFGFDVSNIHDADCAIVMFDTTSRLSFLNVKHWMAMCPGLPIIVCGNKVDIADRKVKESDVVELFSTIPICFMSVKTDTSSVPFVMLEQMLSRD